MSPGDDKRRRYGSAGLGAGLVPARRGTTDAGDHKGRAYGAGK